MRDRGRIRRWRASIAAATLMALTAPGCFPDLGGLRIMYPEAGEPTALMFADDYCSPGGALMPLPPEAEVVLQGEWSEIDDATDLHAVTVRTPDGPVTTADLAGSERPETIAELRGGGIEMICVCITAGRERAVTCADSRGERWTDRRPSPGDH